MNSTPSQKSTNKDNHQISRRSFIGTTAAGGAALLTGGLASLFKDSASARTNFPFVEMSITQLQAAMAAGQLSAKDLVQGYLNRIQQLGPTLNAVIETNTNAIATANSLDRERKAGQVRGPLHWNSAAGQRQHRHGRQHADHGGVAGDLQQPSAG